MRIVAAPAALALAAIAAQHVAAPAAIAGERIALFDFSLENTSLEPTRPDEAARLGLLKEAAVEQLTRRGVEVVDTAPAAAEAEKVARLHDCNGCELDLARRLGADLAAVGWVQKVSNLILNVNMQVREVATGRLVRAGSVDIRGNDDVSWRRGIVYLFERRLYPARG